MASARDLEDDFGVRVEHVLTQMLDGAELVRAVPTGSPVVYALEFKRPEGGYVTCLWTTRGKRILGLQVPEEKQVTRVELLGRESQQQVADGKTDLEVGTAAVYAILIGNAASPHIDNAIQPRVYGTAERGGAT